MLESIVKKSALSTLALTKYGSMQFTTPEGETLNFTGSEPGVAADIQLEDWRVLVNMGLKGDIGFAKDYREGYWHTRDLSALLLFGLQNETVFASFIHGNWWHRQLAKLGYLTKRNTFKGSKQNIEAHYDLGNDFYQLWLDKTMTYSSGLFLNPGDSLEQAQLNKYQYILDKLPAEGQVLEIGCGWGGFAQRLLRNDAYKYTGITLSQAQHAYAIQQLPQNANVLLEDYRHQQGNYDAIVSIEMLEAVGMRYWPTYFDKLKGLLKPQGKAMIQTIVIADNLFAQYAKGADMIRTFIFPGGMLPSLARLEEHIKNAGLRCKSCYKFGQSYAKTLQHWLGTFDKLGAQLTTLGYDEKFQRLWHFYLAACIAGFLSNRINVVQLEIAHA